MNVMTPQQFSFPKRVVIKGQLKIVTTAVLGNPVIAVFNFKIARPVLLRRPTIENAMDPTWNSVLRIIQNTGSVLMYLSIG